MRFPLLAPPSLCRTPIRLVIYGETLDEDGAPVQALVYEGTCNWQDGGGVERTDRQQYVRVTGRAFFPGDIGPELPAITAGYGEILGQRRPIAWGRKGRNPDGSVNFTEVCFQ